MRFTNFGTVCRHFLIFGLTALMIFPAAPSAALFAQQAQASARGSSAKGDLDGQPSNSTDSIDESAPPIIEQGAQSGSRRGQEDPVVANAQVSNQRVGIDVNKVLRLSLRDAVVMALEKNLDIADQRFNVQKAEYDLFSAQGVYDPSFSSTVNFNSSTRPVFFIFSGAAGNSIKTDTVTYNFGIQKLISSGGSFTLDFNNNRVSTDSIGDTLNPRFGSSILFQIRQPLMRNLKIDQARRSIHLSKRRLDISDIQFRQTAINIINQVQNAYWDLVFALQDERIRREAVDLAVVQYRNNKRRIEAGDLAPIELVQSEVQIQTRKEAVIQALQGVSTAENRLKNLILNDPKAEEWVYRIEPTESVEFVPQSYNLEDALALALKNRPEFESLRQQAQINQLDIKYFREQTKPQLDLIGSYQTQGASGTATPAAFSQPTSNAATIQQLTTFNQLITAVNRLTGQNISLFPVPPLIERPSANTISERFLGGQFRNWANLFGNDFRGYSFGVQISIPFSNQTAKANLGRALAESRQLDLQQKRLVQSVQMEVRNALQSLESARQRIESARAARLQAEVQLNGEMQRYAAGLTQNFFVLERQNQLSAAKGSEIRAITDYNKAVADLQRVLSTTLESAGIKLAPNQPSELPEVPSGFTFGLTKSKQSK